MTTRASLATGEKTLIPRESLTESGKWMYITDNSLKLMSFGLLCGGAVSLVMFRSLTARAITTAYGAGFGIGKSYVDTKYILGHDVSADVAWVAEVAPLEKEQATESIQ